MKLYSSCRVFCANAPLTLIVLALSLMSACGGGGSGNSDASIAPIPLAPIAIDCKLPLPEKYSVSFTSNSGTVTMKALCANIFIDPSAEVANQALLSNSYTAAIQANKAFYGTLSLTDPDVVACNYTASNCANYFSGATLRNRILPPNIRFASYSAPRWTVVLISASATANTSIMAHELAHFELAARIGNGQVPAWFNEGLATYIGSEPNCASVTVKGITDLTQLSTSAQWETYTNNFQIIDATYCQARAEVAAWINSRGKAAIPQLLADVRAGGSFNALYGRLLTQ